MSTGPPSIAAKSMGAFQSRQQSKGLLDFAQAGMRDRDAATYPGGAELVTLPDCVGDNVAVELQLGGGTARQVAEQRGFAGRWHVDHHVGRGEKVFDLHRRSAFLFVLSFVLSCRILKLGSIGGT